MVVNRILYQASQSDFRQDVLVHQFVPKMLDAADKLGVHPGEPEIRSWQANSLQIKDLLELAGVQGTYVTMEYKVPYSQKRIDCMLYGRGCDNHNHVVHIEMKQWENKGVRPAESNGNFDVEQDIDDDYLVDAFTGGRNQSVAHPSQQVRGYNQYLENFVEIYTNPAEDTHLQGIAYCYNYRKGGKPDVLFDPKYARLLKEFRTYAGNEVVELAATLRQWLGSGEGLSIFNKVQRSPIHPSSKLLESAAKMLDEGQADAFSLIADQIVARNCILDRIRKLKGADGQKAVIIIKGGPGTGKTVIALHIMALLSKEKLYVCYATKSKSLMEGIKHQLRRGSQAKNLFHNIASFLPADYDENKVDVLLVDEAHRLVKKATNRYTPAQKLTNLSLIETLVRSAKISVFFIDDKQVIRGSEIGSTQLIRETAKRYNATVEEVTLKSQFRCNGSDNYLDWLDQVLYKDSNKKKVTKTFRPADYEFRVFDSPQELYQAIVARNNEPGTTARLCAGFCWPWSKTLGPDGNLVKDVHIGSFAMPWETQEDLTSVARKLGYVPWYEWAYQPSGIKQVGCIYTAQGFEFDYVGVIIGGDLAYDPEHKCLVTHKAANKDPALTKNNPEKFDTYVRNIYRVLLSRGMRGAYVYCCDPALAGYLRTWDTSKHLLYEGKIDRSLGNLRVADASRIDGN